MKLIDIGDLEFGPGAVFAGSAEEIKDLASRVELRGEVEILSAKESERRDRELIEAVAKRLSARAATYGGAPAAVSALRIEAKLLLRADAREIRREGES